MAIDFSIETAFNIPIAFDSTDHLAFICPKCNNEMNIKEVRTLKKVGLHLLGTTTDDCTYIKVYCKNCEIVGQRKFYWRKGLNPDFKQRGMINWKPEVKK
jgi:hypothetical protein